MPGMPSRRAVLTLLAAAVAAAPAAAVRAAEALDDPFGSLQWPDLKREFFGTAKVVFDERVQVRGPAFAEDPMNVPISVSALGLPEVETIETPLRSMTPAAVALRTAIMGGDD